MEVINISNDDVELLLKRNESFYEDFKSKLIKPSKLAQSFSAFMNSSGGELFVGVEEEKKEGQTTYRWDGFQKQEDANDIIGVLHEVDKGGQYYTADFLSNAANSGLILRIVMQKAGVIINTPAGDCYIRKNASNHKVGGEALDNLKYDRGVLRYEDNTVDLDISELCESDVMKNFQNSMIPLTSPEEWLKKQGLLRQGKPTVAAVLLFSDLPQGILPKQSAIKILRYQTTGEARREALVGSPETIEGPIYDLIFNGVARVKSIIEDTKKLGAKAFEDVVYPDEALHELIANAVLHRNYSITTDIQVRIFDNRVEIDSPGTLPGNVTIVNIKDVQYSRNPKIVRIINKFSNPPNKDVGEGINTAINAMGKLRLKSPTFSEENQSFLAVLRHEKLASPEITIMEHLEHHKQISNTKARELTGVSAPTTMREIFNRLRKAGKIKLDKVPGKKNTWSLVDKDNSDDSQS